MANPDCHAVERCIPFRLVLPIWAPLPKSDRLSHRGLNANTYDVATPVGVRIGLALPHLTSGPPALHPCTRPPRS